MSDYYQLLIVGTFLLVLVIRGLQALTEVWFGIPEVLTESMGEFCW